MSEKQINMKYKDTVFRLIFGKYKENALSLYNAINGTSYTDVDDLRVVTLDDAMYVGAKNDVGYVFHDVMLLVEHQSTVNRNIPLRGLEYFALSLKEYVSQVYNNRSVLYSDVLVKIPTPRYYVLYNGKRDQPEAQELRLSDSYEGSGDLEIVAHMLNINKGYNKELLDLCKPLGEYSELVSRVRKGVSDELSYEDAINRAIDSCIADGILAEILRKERDKMGLYFLGELTEEEKQGIEEINRAYYAGIAREEGIQQGLEQGKFYSVDRLISDGVYDKEKACSVLGVSPADYDEYIKSKA